MLSRRTRTSVTSSAKGGASLAEEEEEGWECRNSCVNSHTTKRGTESAATISTRGTTVFHHGSGSEATKPRDTPAVSPEAVCVSLVSASKVNSVTRFCASGTRVEYRAPTPSTRSVAYVYWQYL